MFVGLVKLFRQCATHPFFSQNSGRRQMSQAPAAAIVTVEGAEFSLARHRERQITDTAVVSFFALQKILSADGKISLINSQSLRDCRDFSCPPLSATKKHPACTGRFLWRREGDSELSRASCAALIAARLRGFLLPTSLRHKKHPACTGCFFMAERGRFELPVGDYPNTRFPVVRLRPAQPSLQHDYIIILLFLPFVKGFPGEKSVFLNVSRRYL